MARVSILMNGYNSEKYLKEAIDSIYAQTYNDWEIIFIDNCSTDNTKEIVDSYDNIKYFKTKTNIPLGEARNFGLTKCKGEYLAFLDTDDIWLKDKLKEQIELLDSNRKLQMCYGGAIWIDENGNKIGQDLPKAKTGFIFDKQLIRYEVNMQSVVIRNSIDISFNTSMEFSPDYDLFMRIMSIYQVGVIGRALVKYRKLSNSLTSKKIDRWAIEIEESLNDIFKNNPSLKDKYSREYSLAYAKVGYYYAQYFVSINDMKKARASLFRYRLLNKQYLFLYLLSYFPASIWMWIINLNNK
jgi:glycosyltransferase involved in cell wall biosynthesis